MQGKISSKEKSNFRNRKIFKDFRKSLIEKQKIDPITLKKLTKKANCHHMDLNSENYFNLKEENFIMLNSSSHDLVHLIYEYYRKDKDILDRLKIIVEDMYRINEGQSIR